MVVETGNLGGALIVHLPLDQPIASPKDVLTIVEVCSELSGREEELPGVSPRVGLPCGSLRRHYQDPHRTWCLKKFRGVRSDYQSVPTLSDGTCIVLLLSAQQRMTFRGYTVSDSMCETPTEVTSEWFRCPRLLLLEVNVHSFWSESLPFLERFQCIEFRRLGSYSGPHRRRFRT